MPPRLFEVSQFDQLDYSTAWSMQKHRVEAILNGEAGNLLMLLEHAPVYTVGRSGRADEIVPTERWSDIPVMATDRGGHTTYHGPGQLVAYVICDLRPGHREVRSHVARLEETVLQTLSHWGIVGERELKNPGVWVRGAKIAALGVRIRQGVAYHGLALNRDPSLAHFGGIVPCGLTGRQVTSMANLGFSVSRAELEEQFLCVFQRVFAVQWD